MDDVEEGRESVDLMQFAGERRRQIEAETVDVHLQHPVAQRVHDQLQHLRVRHIERVAGAGVVHVVARLVADQAVVGGVVDPAERQGRAEVVALGRVVVDDVEDDLDPCAVKRLDHLLEFADLPARIPRARVARLR